MIYSSTCLHYLLLHGNSLSILPVSPESVAFQSTCWASRLTHLGAPWLSGQQIEGVVGQRPVQLKPSKCYSVFWSFLLGSGKICFLRIREGLNQRDLRVHYFNPSLDRRENEFQSLSSKAPEVLEATHGVRKWTGWWFGTSSVSGFLFVWVLFY